MKLGRLPLRVSPYRVNWLHAEDLAPGVGHGAVHAAVVVLEDAQRGELARQLVGLLGAVVAVHAQQHQQARADPADRLAVHAHRRLRHPLDDRPHAADRTVEAWPQSMS